MINLRNRTEYSFHTAFGSIDRVLKTNQGTAAGIADRGGTWGHVQWEKKCKAAGIKPIFGVELAVVRDMDLREIQPTNYMAFIAKDNAGLRHIYDLASIASEKFYYEPRIDYSVVNEFTDNIITLSGRNPDWDRLARMDCPNFYIELSPGILIHFRDQKGLLFEKCVATSDNYYCRPEDRPAYEMVMGRFTNLRSTPMHILDEWEWRNAFASDLPSVIFENNQKIADACNVTLPVGEMVRPDKPATLREMCEGAAKRRGIDLSDPIYKARLDRELALIEEKKFEDYFYLVADLCQYAKRHMIVGPARGSSSGSIVCYLLEITEIDPIKYNLLFERFIDINRMDLPDIDIDFPDDKRDMVIDYLKDKYGGECVAQLGTVNRFKPKSAIGDVSKALKIPAWETTDLKDAMIERSGGDARAQFCIMDTFAELEIGKKMLAKYPELAVAGKIEGHAKHTGKHAAGILVTEQPIIRYCSMDEHLGVAQIDKYDAEALNLLKIDALGLRTLSVIQDTLDQTDWDINTLMQYTTDDKEAFEVLNADKFAGIFQFEGYALQFVCKQMRVDYFEDIVSLTALARPGPLNCGGTSEFIGRRMGQKEVEYLHPMAEEVTKVTYGVVVYQEQVMQIAREIGGMSWEDVSALRKAMSKSLGKEFFDKYWQNFKTGAAENDIDEEQAQNIWDNINTMGSWAFNRSHAVAYGMISYWCCVLKAKFPLEFAAANLRKAKDEEQSIRVLRELSKEGYAYKAFDKDKSQINWSVQDGELIGGLQGIKGIGPKTAEDILKRREEGRPLTPRHTKLLEGGETPYDMVFEAQERWGHIFENPAAHGINSKLSLIENITTETHGEFVFIAKLISKNLRDHNEPFYLEKRNGQVMEGQTLFLNIIVEDDTGQVRCTVNRMRYEKLGVPIIEEGSAGDWYIWKGWQSKGFRQINLKRWKKLS